MPTQAPSILVVEDDPDQRDLMVEALSMHYGDTSKGRIHAVGTGGDALALDLSRFDIVLQDYNLPDMTGLDLLPQILAKADVPVVFVTGQNVSAIAGEAIRKGAQDYVVKLGDYLFAVPIVVDKNLRLHEIKKENQRLGNQLQLTLAQLQEKNAQLEVSLQKLETMAATDPMTGLFNRRRFGEILEKYYHEATRYGFDLTCCMCDLDHYKRLNDTMGHQAGDQVLVKASEIIRSSLRASDAGARYGGDEFVLLLPHTSIEQAVAVSTRIRQELGAESGNLFNCKPVTLSIGVASLLVDQPTTAEGLVTMADRALYVAKDRGKDRIVCYSRIGQTAA